MPHVDMRSASQPASHTLANEPPPSFECQSHFKLSLPPVRLSCYHPPFIPHVNESIYLVPAFLVLPLPDYPFVLSSLQTASDGRPWLFDCFPRLFCSFAFHVLQRGLPVVPLLAAGLLCCLQHFPNAYDFPPIGARCVCLHHEPFRKRSVCNAACQAADLLAATAWWDVGTQGRLRLLLLLGRGPGRSLSSLQRCSNHRGASQRDA
jgi:hypothetical protein